VRESRLWALHLVSAVALLALLGMHMTIMHYESILKAFGAAGGPVLGFVSVLARDRSTIMRTLYALLLGFALYHGLYGTRGILREVWSSERAARVINAAVVILGLAVFVYGVAVIALAGRHVAIL
jgi:succinate dehydrogenase / fumarate reductase membrane anchor subunit